MTDDIWLKALGIIIAALPGVIAAISSLRNGRTLDDHLGQVARRHKRNDKTPDPKSKSNVGHPRKADWYKPPDLD
jgi:hypothetical protein